MNFLLGNPAIFCKIYFCKLSQATVNLWHNFGALFYKDTSG